ncbi:MAG: PAS domain S-box protein, partial [Dissulfurispiraceae bacterium]
IPTPGWFIRVGLPTKIAFEPIRSMKNCAYSIALGLSLLSSFLVLLVIRHALRPLYHASRLIKDMTEERLPPQDIPVTHNDEIGQLISSFNVHLNYRRQTEEEFRFHSEIMRNIAEGIYIVRAEDGSIVYANERFEKMFGYEPGGMIGKDVSIVNTPTDKTPEETKEAIIETLTETGEWHGEVNNIRKDGTRFWCYANVSLLEHSKYGKVFVSVHTDITDRKHMEEREQLSETILEHLNQQTGIDNTIRDILQMVKQSTGFDAVGIRLRKGDDFPYFVQDGFSTDFLLTENTLTVSGPDGGRCRDKDGKISLECTCGLIISGHTYTANPLFTPYGSFWINNSVPLLDLPADQDPRLHPRNRCIHEGFHSVALIPLKTGKDIIGLLQLNDRRKDQFTLETIHFFEGLCNSIGIAISRKEVEDALRKSEENLRNITSSLAEGIYVLNKQANIIFMNPEAERLLGWSYTELTGRNIHDVIHCSKADGPPLHLEECSMYNVIRTGVPSVSMNEVFTRKDGTIFPVSIVASPIMENGKVVNAVIAFRDITVRKQIETEREKLIVELQEALAKVKQLSGLLPICASCKKIRDDRGYWNQIETYISEHSEALFSHAICPECGKKLYPEYYDKVWGKEEI